MSVPHEYKGLQTQAIHGGEGPDPRTGASAPNLVMSTTFVIDPDISFSANELAEDAPYVYTRWGNPTIDQLERKLAGLEKAEAAAVFASGMAAIMGLFLHCLKAGDHLIMTDVAYAGAAELTNDVLPEMGVEVTKVDCSDVANVVAAIRPNTKLVYAETPANPILRLTDVAALAELTRSKGIKLVVDSTFATPIGLRPLELGADYVVHSLTKYLGGHGDAIGGALLGRREDIAGVRTLGIHLGGVLSPFNAWLIMRGMATLPIRMRAHEEGALAVAQYLEGHPKVTRVVYPGLPSHPQYELACRQMTNFSGMIQFQTRDGAADARALADRLRVIHYAVSLGHHRSLVVYLPTDNLLRSSFRMTADQEAAYRAYAGDGLFRLSIGLEDAEDLIADLEQALA
ncbi:MAG: PLP-dependent aspartate aminotransferase family protein [Thermoleophilia bacterium]